MNIERFHAHLYYDPKDIDLAKDLLEKIKSNFDLKIGRAWDKPVGPHPIGSCQISFTAKDFHPFLGWLMINRGDIDVFVHGCTDDDYKDHTDYVLWLGKSYELNLDLFR